MKTSKVGSIQYTLNHTSGCLLPILLLSSMFGRVLVIFKTVQHVTHTLTSRAMVAVRQAKKKGGGGSGRQLIRPVDGWVDEGERLSGLRRSWSSNAGLEN